jgi:hypothetical protein
MLFVDEQEKLYKKISDIGWEVNGVVPRTINGNIMYVAKVTSPAGEKAERVGSSATAALANALAYATNLNRVRGMATATVRPSQGNEYGRDAYLKGMSREAMLVSLERQYDSVEWKKFKRLATEGYDATAEQDRESEALASSISKAAREGRMSKYPTTYDLARIGYEVGEPTEIEDLDEALDHVMFSRTATSASVIKQAAALIRSIQKIAGSDSIGLVAGMFFLEDNGYPDAMDVIDDERIAHMILQMRTAEVNEDDLANTLEDELGEKSEERSPDFRFVFFRGVLSIEDFHVNLRHRDMLDEILKDHGKDITDDNVQDDEIATGDVYKRNGELDVKLENLANSETQNQALTAIHNWAKDINLLGDITNVGE